MSIIGAVANLPATALSYLTSHTKKHAAAANGTNALGSTKPAATTGTSGTSGTGSSSGSGTAFGATNIGSTFLNLLVKELQNQDPSAPMDSTAMVGQMISLNQLDQLIAINQAVTPTTSTSTGTGTGAVGTTAGSASAVAARNALLASLSSAQAAAPGSLPSGAAALSAQSTLSAAAASASNAGVLNLSNFNSLFGGK